MEYFAKFDEGSMHSNGLYKRNATLNIYATYFDISVQWYVCWCGLAPALAHIEPVCGQRGKVGRGGGKVAHWDTLPHLPGHKLPGASCN